MDEKWLPKDTNLIYKTYEGEKRVPRQDLTMKLNSVIGHGVGL